jgi:hypothetical protein
MATFLPLDGLADFGKLTFVLWVHVLKDSLHKVPIWILEQNIFFGCAKSQGSCSRCLEKARVFWRHIAAQGIQQGLPTSCVITPGLEVRHTHGKVIAMQLIFVRQAMLQQRDWLPMLFQHEAMVWAPHCLPR